MNFEQLQQGEATGRIPLFLDTSTLKRSILGQNSVTTNSKNTNIRDLNKAINEFIVCQYRNN
jgi:hypothetical protein